MRVDFMVSHCWGLWRQLCVLCFFISRAAFRRPRHHPSGRLPDKAASIRNVYCYLCISGHGHAHFVMSTDLLSRDMVGADHVAPELDLTLEQRGRGFGRFLFGRV